MQTWVSWGQGTEPWLTEGSIGGGEEHLDFSEKELQGYSGFETPLECHQPSNKEEQEVSKIPQGQRSAVLWFTSSQGHNDHSVNPCL